MGPGGSGGPEAPLVLLNIFPKPHLHTSLFFVLYVRDVRMLLCLAAFRCLRLRK